MAPEDVVDGRITQPVTQIVQGADDAVVAPGRVFLDQLEDEFFEFKIKGWLTEGIETLKSPHGSILPTASPEFFGSTG